MLLSRVIEYLYKFLAVTYSFNGPVFIQYPVLAATDRILWGACQAID